MYMGIVCIISQRQTKFVIHVVQVFVLEHDNYIQVMDLHLKLVVDIVNSRTSCDLKVRQSQLVRELPRGKSLMGTVVSLP